jgi:hypothetical protein
MAVDDSGEYPVVHLLDEYVDETGRSSPADDARGILAMLDRNRVPWHRLTFVGGDRVHQPGTGRQKSNKDLQAQIAKRLKVPAAKLRPQVWSAKTGEGRGSGAPRHGCRWLWHAMVGKRFSVNPRCRRAIGALPNFVLRTGDSDEKDPIDAMRYGLDRFIFSRSAAPRARVRLYAD